MFLDQTIQRNQKLAEFAIEKHQLKEILPDSFVVDLDTLLENAKKILDKAKNNQIKLFFMLKQLGRNPYIAKKLIELGYEGAVVVDFKEAEIMMKHNIPLCNVGNLVQIPRGLLKKILTYGCEVVTVFSLDKVIEINEVAKELGIVQSVMVRVYSEKDSIYSGQAAGIELSELNSFIQTCKEMKYIKINGVTSFPCFLYDDVKKDISATENFYTVKKAQQILEENALRCEHINVPSATCVHTLEIIKELGGNEAEPGHGFSGTTPAHLCMDLEEQPCVFYLSEISHNFKQKSYCFGGGYYRRSHVQNVWVGSSFLDGRVLKVTPPALESIDYYFQIEDECKVSQTVLMAFRFQIFVTRSNVVLIEGLKKGNPRIAGRYTSLGDEVHE